VPGLRRVLELAPLGGQQLAVVFLALVVTFGFSELLVRALRRGTPKPTSIRAPA
jgi:hypothetical protein